MSQLQVNRINDASGGVLAPISSVMRNRLINSAMVIDQRNAGASVTPNNQYTLDRWAFNNSQTGKATSQQNAGSVTPPTGFTNYLGITSSSAYSVLTDDFFFLDQKVEGFNAADLGWGTANAKTVTLSFQVYSSLTGTFGGSLRNSGGSRSYPFSYSIPTANTWTSINITIAGDTSGTWLITNGIGIDISFSLGTGTTFSGTAGAWSGSNFVSATGATSVVGTSGATFYITGVQLEVGTQATSFEYRQYQQELALCQRYFQFAPQYASGLCYTASIAGVTFQLPVQLRTAPTLTIASVPNIIFKQSNGATITGTTLNSSTLYNNSLYIEISGLSGLSQGNATVANQGSTNSALSAEL